MSETSTDAAPSTKPEAKMQPSTPESRRSAKRAVEAMIVNKYKTTRLGADGERKPSAGPTDDYIDTYQQLTGESPQLRFTGGTPIELKGLKTPTGEEPFKDQNLVLYEVRGASADGKFLNCYAKGPDGKVLLKDGATDPDDLDQRVRIELPRESVLLLQLQSQAKEYAGLFDGEQKALVEAVIKDDDQLPTSLESTIDTVKAETGARIRDEDFPEPETEAKIPEHLVEANEALGDQIAFLQHRIENGNLDEKVKARAERTLKQLKTAQKINGELGGAIYKTAVFYAAKELWADLGDTELVITAADKAIKALENHVTDDKTEIIKILESNGVPPDKIAELKQITENASSPEHVTDLMASLSSLDLPDMTTRIFGESVNTAQAQILMNEIIDNSGLDNKQKELLHKVGKGALWALIAALVAAGGVIVGSGAIATTAASGLGGGRR